MINCLDSKSGTDWSLYHGDCVDVVRQMPDRSIDLAVYSPPFSNLYTYSDSALDMGNSSDDDEFLEHYGFLVDELYRTLRPGRICAVHCKDLVEYAGSSESGMAGLRDFSGELIKAHKRRGFALAGRITIWRCPVTEQRKTNRHALLYKQLRTDSTFSAVGMPEYMLVFRKWALTDEEKAAVVPVPHDRSDFPLEQWQRWASPVWWDMRAAAMNMDSEAARAMFDSIELEGLDPGAIDGTDVLNVRAAREDRDEKHMCPLPLEIIRRIVLMYSNEGEVVLSPFAGIGSEPYVALQEGRKAVGVELKASYFQRAVINVESVAQQPSLFSLMAQ